jgi:serine/threonine protein kinase
MPPAGRAPTSSPRRLGPIFEPVANGALSAVIASSAVLSDEKDAPFTVGAYVLFQEVSQGGMASVHLARRTGAEAATRIVAIKRLLPVFAKDSEFVAMFTDESRRMERVRHANVVSVLDVVSTDGEVLQVMDYVPGETLGQLIRAAGKRRIAMPRRVLLRIMVGVLAALEAAHETRDEGGEEILHGDVSPFDVLVGLDGVPKVFNFGLAKGLLRERAAEHSAQVRSKHAYMSPEQLRGGTVDRRTDIYSAGVMLWEGLTGRRLFDPKNPPEASDIVARMQMGQIELPSSVIASTPKALDQIVMKALSGVPADRFGTAREMALAIENAVPKIPDRLVGAWVAEVAGEALRARAAEVSAIQGAELPGAEPSPESAVSNPPPLPLTSLIDLAAFASFSTPPVDIRAHRAPMIEPRPTIEPVHEEAPLPASPRVPDSSPRSARSQASSARARSSRPPPPRPQAFLWVAGVACAAIVLATVWILGFRLEGDPPVPVAGPPTAAPPAAIPPRAARTAAPSQAPTSVAPANDCEPPFTIDADGGHVAKPACVH